LLCCLVNLLTQRLWPNNLFILATTSSIPLTQPKIREHHALYLRTTNYPMISGKTDLTVAWLVRIERMRGTQPLLPLAYSV